jgi:hypothetical protein
MAWWKTPHQGEPMNAMYLAPLSDQQLLRLRQAMRRASQALDLDGWEDAAADCSDITLDTWTEMCTRLPRVYAGHLT